MTDIGAAALAYLDGWKQKDADSIADRLHPEVTFLDPLTRHDGREAVMSSFTALFPVLHDVAVRHLSVDGDHAVAIYNFVCVDPVRSLRTAELLGLRDGLIHSIEMFFDPRALMAAST